MSNLSHETYERLRFMHFTNREIANLTQTPYNTLYKNNYVANFNMDYPEFKLDKAVQLEQAHRLAKQHAELTRVGLTSREISQQLDMATPVINAMLDIHYTNTLKQETAKQHIQLIDDVKNAKRSDKFKLIKAYRDDLLKDYGGTLMNVPANEPRLAILQEANNSLQS